MSKQQILLLLLPCVLFVAMAICALRMSAVRRIAPASEPAFEEAVEKARREGTSEKVLNLLRSSRRVEIANHELQSHMSRFLRVLGWGLLVGVGIQAYGARRLRHGKQNGEPAAAPNGGPATSFGNSGVTERPPSVS
jgi:hypothetical protein